MSPERQRVVIAELCGWKFETVPNSAYQNAGMFVYHNDIKHGFIFASDRPRVVEIRLKHFGIPDYLNDLNAAQSAFQKLDGQQKRMCIYYVVDLLQRGQFLFDATAAQWSQGISKTLSK